MVAALIGNYGVGNLGDEALKEYFLTFYPEVEWKVLSACPEAGEYARLPAGWRSLFGFRWIRTLRMLRHVDAVVFGGGSLFTDVESPFACFLWWIHARAASLFGKPIVLAFQGMGPYKTKKGEWFARDTVARAAFISVRDRESYDRIGGWSKNTKVVQTFDPIFSLFIAKKEVTNPTNVFTVIPRKNSSQMFLENVRKIIQSTPWEEVRVVLMEGGHQDEREIAQSILSISVGRGRVVAVQTIDELMDSVRDASLVASQRFHGALAALAADVPLKVFPQGEGDKLSIVASLLESGSDMRSELVATVRTGEDALHAWFRTGK